MHTETFVFNTNEYICIQKSIYSIHGCTKVYSTLVDTCIQTKVFKSANLYTHIKFEFLNIYIYELKKKYMK